MLLAALVLGALAAVDLAIVLLWRPADDDWQLVGHRLLFELWPLLVIAAFLMTVYELYLHRRLLSEIARIAGPGIVETLLPQQVMRTFLSSIY
ncbi:MAG TPA: hypothetical protein VNO31_11885, partial [Umezawaea sp.]|nr:hypothetical protein [Umezawaea sp.]